MTDPDPIAQARVHVNIHGDTGGAQAFALIAIAEELRKINAVELAVRAEAGPETAIGDGADAILFTHTDPDGDRVDLVENGGSLILRTESLDEDSRTLVLLNRDACEALVNAVDGFLVANLGREF